MMAAVKTATDPKRRSDFLDSMEEEIRRVSEHLERRERRLGLKGRRGEIMNGYSFSEGSGAEAGARRRRINHYPRQFRPSEEDRSSTSSPDTRSPSPGPRSAPPVHSLPRGFREQLQPTVDDSTTPEPNSPESIKSSERSTSTESERIPGKDLQKAVTISNRSRRAVSSSPLRKLKSPPPVAPKPRSRGSPGPLSTPHRQRAGSAPPPHSHTHHPVTSDQEDPVTPSAMIQEEDAIIDESIEIIESEPTTPLISNDTPTPLTPEPSESLMVIHQQHHEHSTTPESNCSTLSPPPSSSCLNIAESRGMEAASPGIIEISGNFSFAKKKTIDRTNEQQQQQHSVTPIMEETGEMKEGGEEEGDEERGQEGGKGERGKGKEGREEGLQPVDEMIGVPNVENALLEAIMENEINEDQQMQDDDSASEDISQDPPVISDPPIIPDPSLLPAPQRTDNSDPQGPEIKSLPMISPAESRRAGTTPRHSHSNELLLLVKDLQLQLREKEEELGRQRRTAAREARDKEEQVNRLTKEGQKLEREKWELLKRARDGAERSLSLRTQLDLKETQLRSLQADLGRTRDEMMSVKSANTSLRALLSELRTPKPSKDAGVQVNIDSGGTLRRNHSMELAVQELSRPPSRNLERGIDYRASTTHLDRGSNHRVSNCSAMSEGWVITQGMWERNSAHLERNSVHWEREQSVTSAASSQYDPLNSREATPSFSPHMSKKMKKKKAPLFSKLRKSVGKRGSTPTILDGVCVDLSQSSLVQGHSQTPISFPYHTRLSTDTQEHWKILEEAGHIPFHNWNGRNIVAWVTTGLGMGQYISAVKDHVTTGNTMLALSDSDMEKKLGVANPLHRRKLRLAIEEQRRPDRVRYLMAGKIDSGWLAEIWVTDIGLPQLADTMATHLVDGRVLESLTKDDLKKYFKLKKMEQMSFLAGVELLRMHDYNREAILEHRDSQQSRSSIQNPLYWTNRDVGDWLRDIQLGEYASNLLQSGVHGALLFLERGDKGKFTADHLAQILQLPSGKSAARRHLTQQLGRLFREDVNNCESPFHSQRNSVISFQSNISGVSPISPPYSGGSLYRAGSSPSLNQTGFPIERMTMEERIRHSLRESALRSVTSSTMSPRTPSPSSSPSSQFSQFSHPPSPHLPTAPSPLTHTKTSGTTV